MKNSWKWFLGISLAWMALFVLPFIWGFFMPYRGFGMTPYNGAWGMPMMYNGFGMMGFGMLVVMPLISIGLLVLIALSIVWLVRELKIPKA